MLPALGRETELAVLRAFVEAEGPAAALVIEGPAGIGKTTLWRAAVAHAEEHGRRVLSTRVRHAEQRLAYAGLDTLCGGLFDELGEDLPLPQRVALGTALLRAEPGSRGVPARAVATGTLGLIRLAAARSPALVAVDDVQWLDDASRGALAFAFHRLEDEDVRLLLASRDGGGVGELELDASRLAHVEVGPLDVAPLRALARERTGETLSIAAGRRLAELSGGNPFYALELIGRDLLAAGPVDLPLDRLVGDRLAGLPARTRSALGAVAALARPRVELVTALGGGRALDPAFAAGVLVEEDGAVSFAHPLLASAAYGALGPSERRGVHRRAAELAADPEERAHHLAAATVDAGADVAAAIDDGAASAARRGAPSTAAQLYEAAARLTPADERDAAARRRVEAARELFAAGDSRRGIERSRQLITELPPGDLRADALTTMACTGTIPLDEAKRLCTQAVAEARTPESRARSLLLYANVAMTSSMERAHELAAEALVALGDGGDPGLRAWALGSLGSYEMFAHPSGEGIRMLREASALEPTDQSAAPLLDFSPTRMLGLALSIRDELDEGRALLERQLALAAASGDEHSTASIAMHLTELECKAGRLERARELADAALQAADEGFDAQGLGGVLFARALVAALQGDESLARELASRGIATGEAVGDRVFPVKNRGVLGLLELSLGRPEGAMEHLEGAPEVRRRHAINEPGGATFVPDCIEALIATGRLDEATEELEIWERTGRELGRARLLATAARCRGLLSAARGDLDGALASFDRALAEHGRFECPHELARTQLAYAAVLRRAGRRRDARAQLDDALATFEALGEPLWAERVRAEARRLGGRTPSEGSLTASERRVAELVAQGRSNREVASSLFVTVRTVEANLTRVYSKLGVRSRAELAARWRSI
ncbi:MAG TPA: AAA family ATPase [Gaiellaceae bacterium]|nr:AAA family ATPase [Gaiellaceae bacterium]